MELFELKANIRENTGKNANRVLRQDDLVPAICYGPGAENVMLSVATRDLELAFKSCDTSQVLVNLKYSTDGKDVERSVIIKDVQADPYNGSIVHVDLLEIDLNKRTRAKVAVTTTGKSKGVELGGILQVVRRELEVLCMPLELPPAIELDVAELGIGNSIHVDDIDIEGIEIPHDVNFTVVTVVPPKGGLKTLEGAEEEGE